MIKKIEIIGCEQEITSLKMQIAGSTDPAHKRWLKQRLIEEQEKLKRMKKK